MSEPIPSEFGDVFERESIAHLATLDPDGGPHVTPLWVDYDVDTGHVLVNTVRGRRKERNVNRDSRVALSVLDPDNPYRHVALRGEVVGVSESGAVNHIDRLAGEYLGVDEYPNRDSEAGPRVVLRIRPDEVHTMHRPNPTAGGLVRYGLRRFRSALGFA